MGGFEAVHDDGIAAFCRVLEAIEDLQGGHRVAIGIVGVGLQAKTGIGQVGRIDLGAHLEPLAVVCFAHEAESLDDIKQCALAGRPAGELGKAVATDMGQPVAQGIRAGPNGGKFASGYGPDGIGVPGEKFRRQPAGLDLAGPVIEMGEQPVRGKGHGLFFRGKGDGQRRAIGVGTAQAVVVGDVDQGDQPLAVAAGPRLLVQRIVSQPDGVKARPGAVAQVQLQRSTVLDQVGRIDGGGHGVQGLPGDCRG